MSGSTGPRVSIVVEGKNERNRSDEIPCIEGLRRQRRSLADVELIFAGGAREAALFERAAADLPVAARR